MRFDSIHTLAITFLSISPTSFLLCRKDDTSIQHRNSVTDSTAVCCRDSSHALASTWVTETSTKTSEPTGHIELAIWGSWWDRLLLNNIERFPQKPRPPPSCTDCQIVWCNTLQLVKLDSACNAKFVITTTIIIVNHDFGGSEKELSVDQPAETQKWQGCGSQACEWLPKRLAGSYLSPR